MACRASATALRHGDPRRHGNRRRASHEWLDCRGTEHAEDPAAWFLRHGVRVNPGEEFGADGQGRVRLNYATSRALLDELLGRLAA